QNERESIREFTNRYEANAEAVKTQLRNDEKHDWYLRGLKKPYRTKVEIAALKIISKEKDVKDRGTAALSTNRVEQEEKLNQNDIENMIQHAVIKTIKDLNCKQTQQKASKPRIYYLYKQEGHIKGFTIGVEYLKIKLLNEDECGDIRAFGKRKRNNYNVAVFIPSRKKEKVNENKRKGQQVKSRENMIYILFTELADELDLLKRLSVKINGDTVKAPIDPGSCINLMLKRYAVKRGVSQFMDYIPDIEVNMEGLINARAQCFLSFKGTEYWYTISSSTRSTSFVVSTVSRSWVNEVLIDDYIDEVDSNDDGDFDDIDDIITLLRYNDEKNNRLIERKDIFVVSRLMMENSALINLEPKVRNELIRSIVINQLVSKVPEVFAYKLKDIGKTNLVEYEVRTSDTVILSIRLQQIRINNPKMRKVFEDYLKQMIECGLLEKGSDEYAYHCFFVQKKERRTDKIRAMNASETFQRLIGRLLDGKKWKNVTVAYQDNISIWTNRSMEKYLKTFIELAKGLIFAAKKCFILYNELKMYGYVVSKDEPEENDVFELLKQKLSEEVILKASDWQVAKDGQKLYHMYTDVCDTSVRVVLEQEDDKGRLKPTDNDFVEGLLYYVGLENQKINDLFLVKQYLQQLSWRPYVDAHDLPRLKRKLKCYCLIRENLYLRSKKRAPPRHVVLEDHDKQDIVKASHKKLANKGGYRGINMTLTLVKMKYIWRSGNMCKDVKKIVSSCEQCQRCAPKLPPEPIHVTVTS
ncbi:11552_t:CDS:10, partial [Ambispora leptoticha]